MHSLIIVEGFTPDEQTVIRQLSTSRCGGLAILDTLSVRHIKANEIKTDNNAAFERIMQALSN